MKAPPLPPPLLDPGFHAGDPYPAYRRLRREAPLFWHPEGGLWIVSRHADVVAISRDPQTFCSRGGVLPSDAIRDVDEHDSIIYMDPPLHRRYRALVQPGFSRRRVRELETRVRAIARGLLEQIPRDLEFDFVDALASPLPTLVIAELLGIPGDRRADFRRWSDAVIDAATEANAENAAEIGELLGYLSAILDERRARPSDDLISQLLTARIGDEALAPQDLLMFCLTLLVAGNETTRNLLSHGALALADHPDQRKLLVEEPARTAAAVEEMLRWESPVIGFLRTATRDAELRGRCIRKGERLWLLYAAANRDEAEFGPTAEAFDVTRRPNNHVAFGRGEHFCLGASLARLEARVCFEELLARFPHLALSGDPERLPSTLMRSLVRLPLLGSA